jgi:aryl-alcohol dehydrogenase-like predicted oxidoreductase
MQTMRAKRRLGESDLEITPIGFGAWAAGGGDWTFGWGPQDDADSISAIRRALELGVNWIDTAAVYGFGHSEEVVAKAVAGMSERPYIFTKCGQVPDGHGSAVEDLSRDSIRRECEASLRRLRVETIDLYQIHWPSDEIADIDEGWGTLVELQREGKVRHIGVSNFDIQEMDRARAIAPITSLQPPYSIVRPQNERDVLPYCLANGIGVIVYSPMQAGLLSGAMTRERIAGFPKNDWRSRNAEFAEPKLTKNLETAALLAEIGAAHGRSAGEVAIAWTLHNPAVTGAIVGGRSAAQIDGIIGAMEFRLDAAEVARIAAQRS